MREFYRPYIPISGWVGSLDDLRSTVRNFQELKEKIIFDEIIRIESFNLEGLRNKRISSDDLLSVLDEQIENFKDSVKLTLILKDENGTAREFIDNEIDNGLNSQNPRRIKALELKIEYPFYESPTKNSTAIKFLAFDDDSHIVVASDYDATIYVRWLKKRLRLNRPKLVFIRSNWFKNLLVVTFTLVLLSALYSNSIVLQIIALLASIPIFIILPIALKALNPKFEVYPNDKSPLLVRTMTWLVPTLIGLVGTIAAIIAIIPK